MTASGRRPTLLYHLYRGATQVLAPLIWWSVRRKLSKAGIETQRQWERLGHASERRPPVLLIWLHGASVGESLTALTLVDGLSKHIPRAHFLITSGTATSADLVKQRARDHTIHQFAPLDTPGPVRRFLDHWKPDAGIFVESELWPVTLAESNDFAVPLALVNARLSDKSVDGWCKFPDTAAFVVNHFRILIAQSRRAADNLNRMGADPERVTIGGNLKAFAKAQHADANALADVTTALAGRPVWAAASTHPGEEDIALRAHAQLLHDVPDLCLLLIPRHPDRADEVAARISDMGLTYTRRSSGGTPTAQVYLADTLGEMALWYALVPFVFLGGSLVKMGGHNPFEPAQARAAVLTGPHFGNFSESFEPLIASGGALQVLDAETLAKAAAHWLRDEAACLSAQEAAFHFATHRSDKFEQVIDRLIQELNLA